MACSKQPGPASYLHFIEETTGERITQSEWHQIRQLAAQSNGGVSRRRVTQDEAMDVARELAARLYVDNGVEFGPADDAESFDKNADTLFERVADVNNTEGTVAIIRYLGENGVEDTLQRIRGKKKGSKKAERKCSDCGSSDVLLLADGDYECQDCGTIEMGEAPVKPETTVPPAEYADTDWASEVYWPNVPADEREAFAWAVDSPTLAFYLPATDEDGVEKGHADINAAGEVAHAFQSLSADASDDDVISALSNSELREYFYLAEDGGNHPAVTLWEEWKANGPRG